MDILVALVALGGFGYFIYTRVKKSKEDRDARRGSGSVGHRDGDHDTEAR